MLSNEHTISCQYIYLHMIMFIGHTLIPSYRFFMAFKINNIFLGVTKEILGIWFLWWS